MRFVKANRIHVRGGSIIGERRKMNGVDLLKTITISQSKHIADNDDNLILLRRKLKEIRL